MIMCGFDGEEEYATPPHFDTINEETLEESSKVSLHTLTNLVNPQTFCILAKHKDETLKVLIDTRSNNNFIKEGLVRKFGLLVEPAKRFKVYMGNGQHLACHQKCMGLTLVMQGHLFKVDFLLYLFVG